MDDAPLPTHLDEHAVRRVLRRAAELDEGVPAAELARAAAETGISAAALEAALREEQQALPEPARGEIEEIRRQVQHHYYRVTLPSFAGLCGLGILGGVGGYFEAAGFLILGGLFGLVATSRSAEPLLTRLASLLRRR